MLKKIINLLIVFTLLIGICGNVYAEELETKLEIIKKSSKTEYLENDQGYLSKEITDSDLEAGEVTIKSTLINKKKDVEESTTTYDNTEIFIIVDENIASKEEKLNMYISYIEKLSNKILDKNSNTKIGIIGMTGPIYDGYVDQNTNELILTENDQSKVAGAATNAEIVINLTDNKENIKSSLENMNSTKTEYYSNLQAAIGLANNSFSKDVNKILICLYDGVPLTAIGQKASADTGWGVSLEQGVKNKNEKVATYTHDEILKLANNNVDLIILRPDDTSYDQDWYQNGEFAFRFDGSPYVQKIYGTMDNPTYGKMYSLKDSNLQTIVEEYIYEDIIETVAVDIKSAVIKEYFPKEIIDNFDIIFSDKNIDTTNLKEDGYITWEIGDIKGNSSASLEYKLKIKNMKNEALLDKVLDTTEKTELKYINYLDKETTVTTTSSPQIKLSEVKEELTVTVTYDPTTNTTGKVTATIKTNKKVNEVDGWTLSKDGKTLTKQYSKNMSETVYLTDIDDMTKEVKVKISNIVEKDKNTDKNTNDTNKDKTQAPDKLPQAGLKTTIYIAIVVMILIAVTMYKKLNKYKDIK